MRQPSLVMRNSAVRQRIHRRCSTSSRGDLLWTLQGSHTTWKEQKVVIDQDGNVYVNGNLIDEPYLQEKAFGECNI